MAADVANDNFELCICAERIEECAKYPCGHQLCTTCSLRMRALMNDKSCPYCRDVADKVAFVSSVAESYESAAIPLQKYGIMCGTNDIRKNILHVTKMPCPTCDQETQTLKSLKDHVHKVHKQHVCKICANHSFQFSTEFVLYSGSKLHQHMQKDHAFCEFCQWHYYSTDDLAKHCRREHELCFICEREDPMHPQYYTNYQKLEEHFMEKHFLCTVPQCLEDKFVVFSSRLELQSHMVEKHREIVGNVRQFQRVAMEDLREDLNSIRVSSVTADAEKEREVVIKRYNERLRIDVNHDKGKMDQIYQANKTFETKYVPVQAFISTYSSIVPSTASEITALLQEYAKFTPVNHDKRRELEAAIARRINEQNLRQASAGPSTSQPQTPARAGSPRSNTASPKPGSSGPSRATVPVAGWVAQSTKRGGNINLSNLPSLAAVKKGSPAFLNRPPAIASTRKPQPVRATPSPSVPGITIGGGPQTRLPSLSSRNGRIAAAALDYSIVNGPSPSAPVTHNTSPIGSGAPSRSGSSQSLSTAGLPSLPRINGNASNVLNGQRKQSKRVLRIV